RRKVVDLELAEVLTDGVIEQADLAGQPGHGGRPRVAVAELGVEQALEPGAVVGGASRRVDVVLLALIPAQRGTAEPFGFARQGGIELVAELSTCGCGHVAHHAPELFGSEQHNVRRFASIESRPTRRHADLDRPHWAYCHSVIR
ncbi:MAG: hypothetical protein JOZ49_08380, partial [Mycolicibacterium sp.]|nr:hypothetical protein [Mycolicibacterium sp.]